MCPDLARTPRVLAVGDLHVENFGTWRDSEGRLVWGVNDFDEAYTMPHANDLVRLATSALLAIRQSQLTLKPVAACDAVLAGYREGLAAGGQPFVLAEHHEWLRQIAQGALRDPAVFWRKLDTLAGVRGGVPASAQEAMGSLMPDGATEHRRDEARLLHAMGRETANIHLGSHEAAGAVRRDLERQPDGWLSKSSEKMVEANEKDWEAWKSGRC